MNDCSERAILFSKLHCHEVINLCDGSSLGQVSDLLVEPSSGMITALAVPGEAHCFGLFRSGKGELIPWNCIETLGEDYILVRWKKGAG